MLVALAWVAVGSLTVSSVYMLAVSHRCRTINHVYGCLGTATTLGIGAGWIASALLP